MLDSPIEEIKSRVNVLDVVQDFVQLKKAGTNYKGLCPFHSEKTGSFMVSPAKQIWHCFGCGLGGDIFEFIKQIENIEFAEALKILADRAGVTLKKPTQEQIQMGEKKDVLFEINEQAAKYFARVLWESNAGKEALEYLKKRGLTDQTIKNWQLGYAPADFHYLENFLAKNFNKKDIEQAGLIIKSDRDNGYFDRFHDRVMFPIQNLHGQVVGFTGRLLHEKPNAGKYVNSPETPIYSKSQVIFGLHAAKNSIRKENRAIVMEGNMDVISAHQAGSIQAVATSGTAMTQDQLLILKRFTENLIFAFDSDTAGITAGKRALELALNLGFNVKVINLNGAKDPDDLIKRGTGIWQKAVESAGNFLDFFFDLTLKQMDASTVEGKRDITRELAPLIFRISEPITRAHYVRKLSGALNVAESAIWDIINRLSLPKPLKVALRAEKRKNRKNMLEERFLGLSLIEQDNQWLKGLTEADFDPEYQALVAVMQNTARPSEIIRANPTLKDQVELLQFAAETEMKEQEMNPVTELKQSAVEFKRDRLKNKMKVLGDGIKQAETAGDQAQIASLSAEYVAVSHALNQLNLNN
jgi:DNA primase